MDGWGILWLQVSHKIVGGASRARYEHYKGAVTIEAAFSAGCRKYDIRWDLKHCFLMPYDLVFDPLTAVAPGPLAINAGGVVNEKWRHDLVFNPWTALAQGPLARPVSQQCWWCRLRKMAPFVAFLLQKGVTFALQKLAWCLSLWMSARSYCRLCLCVYCKLSRKSLVRTHEKVFARTAVPSMDFLLPSSEFANARNIGLKREPHTQSTW
jgi:hypothetical protein